MQANNGYKTREEFAPELNMCARTMSRKLQKVGYEMPERELLSPEVQREIKEKLKIISVVQ
jgi:hypothetical protein